MNASAEDTSLGQRMAIAQDMTIYHAETLKDELLAGLNGAAAVELDLSQVAEIDTSGIQLLMLVKRESQKQGKTLAIVAHSPAVQELLDFYNLAGFFGDPLVIPAPKVN